jgi:hypothetical protein
LSWRSATTTPGTGSGRSSAGATSTTGDAFLTRPVAALGLNLVLLQILVGFGAGKVLAQAISIVLVMPFSFTANKLWSFRQ